MTAWSEWLGELHRVPCISTRAAKKHDRRTSHLDGILNVTVGTIEVTSNASIATQHQARRQGVPLGAYKKHPHFIFCLRAWTPPTRRHLINGPIVIYTFANHNAERYSPVRLCYGSNKYTCKLTSGRDNAKYDQSWL